MVNFPTRIPDCHTHSPAPLDLCFSSDISVFTTMAVPPLLVNFVSGCKFKLMFIFFIATIRSGQSSLFSIVFSCLCATAMTKKNHFFVCTNSKSSESIVRFRHASYHSYIFEVLRLPNLHTLIEQMSLSISRNVALVNFGKLLIVFSTTVNVLCFPYSAAQSYCLLHLTKQNILLKTFLRTLILMILLSICLLFLLELFWNRIIFL